MLLTDGLDAFNVIMSGVVGAAMLIVENCDVFNNTIDYSNLISDNGEYNA